MGFTKEECGDYKSSGYPQSKRVNLQKAYFRQTGKAEIIPPNLLEGLDFTR